MIVYVIPGSVANVPAAHTAHVSEAAAPTAIENLPDSQAVHAEEL